MPLCQIDVTPSTPVFMGEKQNFHLIGYARNTVF